MGKRSRSLTPSGSMRQRTPGSWELRVYAGVDARTGRVRYRTRTVRCSRGDAARALKELVAVVQSGPAFGAEAPFSTLLETWIAAKVSVWSAGTLMETRSIARIHLLPRLGRVPVGAITTEQIDMLLAVVGRTRSAGTVNRVRGVVHAVLAQAVRWDWIWSNPASHAARVETGPKSHVVPPPEVVMRVLEWLRLSDPVFMLFVRLAATTGARRGELLGLRWSDIDFENSRVRLVRGLVDATGGPVLQERKTKNANCVDLDADTIAILRAHHEHAVERAADTGLVVGLCPLFGQRHDASMLAAGIGLPVVAARLGHARVSTTLNVYAASMPAWDRAAAETLSTLLRAS